MINKFYRKTLVYIVIILFIISAFLPVINGELTGIESQETLIKNQETYPFTFYTFDKTGSKECQVDLSVDIGEEINDELEMLKYQIIIDPLSEKTKVLKQDFVETIDTYGLIPAGMNKDDVLKLLNPSWLSLLNKKIHANFKDALVKIINSRFNYPFLKYYNAASSSDWNILCNIASSGAGVPLPLFMLPRPRGLALWFSSAGATYTSSLLTSKSFVARGQQQGLAVGFYGVGLTGSFYGMTGYIFTGYASYTMMQAEDFDYFTPPNHEPEILDETPVNGAVDVPLSLSELSFRISDADGDRMSYSVVTSPDIGSGSGMFKKNGVYKIPISGLENNRGYSWSVEVSDGKDITVKEFSFSTEVLPFNPFEEGWMYRKKITINHDMVTGNLNDFPVLVSRVDSDLKLKAQSDGDDILFMDNIGVANKLFHEIEKFDVSSGDLVAWVKIPEIPDSVDTILYMYYGNPSCGNQQYPVQVWDSDFIAVYHMDSENILLQDSTKHRDGIKDGTANPKQHKGIIGNAQDFKQDNKDTIEAQRITDLSQFTLELWYDPESTNDNDVLIEQSNKNLENYNRLTFWFLYRGDLGGDLQFGLTDGLTWMTEIIDNSNIVDMSYCVGTYSRTQFARIYVNAVKTAEDLTISGTEPNNDGMKLYLGSDFLLSVGERYWADGIMDEVRISDIVRSESWIKTTYNTMCDPTGFFSIGLEESSP